MLVSKPNGASITFKPTKKGLYALNNQSSGWEFFGLYALGNHSSGWTHINMVDDHKQEYINVIITIPS